MAREMTDNKIPTEFAPAERTSTEVVKAQSIIVENEPLINMITNAVTDIVLVLNEHRQIIYSNQLLFNLLGIPEVDNVFGLRPGEVLDCIHAKKTKGGCGTTEFCSTCGAVKAILKSQAGIKDVQECRVLQATSGEALDLRVIATPLEVEGERFTVFSVSDISHEKRRHVLERTFFHDVLNTAGGLQGLAELLIEADEDEMAELSGSVYRVSERLVQEIKTQRMLNAAESDELQVGVDTIQSMDLLNAVREIYEAHDICEDRHMQIDSEAVAVEFESDETLISRVIGNMVKNALEASREGDTVTMGCQRKDNRIEFWVNNPTFMPREVQLQVFQRSFSTKGGGRGLGTYSMKLLTDRYLKGEVSFTSLETQGTTFRATYPLSLT